MLHRGHPVAQIARRLEDGRKNNQEVIAIAAYFPANGSGNHADYRTREDPLEPFWPEIEELLKEDPG